MKYPYATTLFLALGLVGTACSDDDTTVETGATETGTETSTGDGDGDPATGDGDGDATGDGDGDATGDGDGDMTTTGDGDGDMTTTGDGDGDMTGDGDGDMTGDGDGDGTGDGDGDMTGDGDGDGTGDGDGDMPDDDTIYECQDGTIALDTPVDVDGVWVTAVRDNGFFAQEEAGGEESGIWVFVGGEGPDISELVIGDLVDIEGTLVEFGDIDEIDASLGTVTEVGVLDPIPMPDIVTADLLVPEIGEVWESVYVRLEGMPLAVVELPGFDEFVVADGGPNGDPALVDDYIYNLFDAMDFANFGVGASFTAVQGVVNWSFGNFKIAPRFPMDLEGYMEAPPPPFIGVNDLSPGDLVITELMPNPGICSDNNCEWLEVFNASGEQVNLQGLIIGDNTQNTGTVAGEVIVNDGEYAWLGRSNEMNWGYTDPADGHYGANPAFNQGGDIATISNDNELIDAMAAYPGTTNGVSWQLDAGSIDAVSNDDFANFCLSTNLYEDPEAGTPGAANDACN